MFLFDFASLERPVQLQRTQVLFQVCAWDGGITTGHGPGSASVPAQLAIQPRAATPNPREATANPATRPDPWRLVAIRLALWGDALERADRAAR
eukprot:11579888-Alexandrium_andersonii.AAC.1